MRAGKYEKSFDNHRAALVSREPRAPRAADKRKSFAIKTLDLIHRRQTARGAHVSRAARRSNAPRNCARRTKSAYFVRGSLGNATTGKMPKMLHFVAFCCIALHGGHTSMETRVRKEELSLGVFTSCVHLACRHWGGNIYSLFSPEAGGLLQK
jgi:hypothetical protein